MELKCSFRTCTAAEKSALAGASSAREKRAPTLVDSHTHPVFAGDRSDEAAARLEGRPYEAGGILRTVAATRQGWMAFWGWIERGRALLSRVAHTALERGWGRMEWAALDWNEPAIRFYEGLGARRMAEWRLFRLSGDALQRVAQPASGT